MVIYSLCPTKNHSKPFRVWDGLKRRQERINTKKFNKIWGWFKLMEWFLSLGQNQLLPFIFYFLFYNESCFHVFNGKLWSECILKKNQDGIALDMVAHWVCVLPVYVISTSCKVIFFHCSVFWLSGIILVLLSGKLEIFGYFKIHWFISSCGAGLSQFEPSCNVLCNS